MYKSKISLVKRHLKAARAYAMILIEGANLIPRNDDAIEGELKNINSQREHCRWYGNYRTRILPFVEMYG